MTITGRWRAARRRTLRQRVTQLEQVTSAQSRLLAELGAWCRPDWDEHCATAIRHTIHTADRSTR